MNYLNDPHYDVDEAQLDHFDQSSAKRQRYLLWKERLNQVELQIEKDEAAPDPDADLSPKKKRLKRQIKEEALLRLEEAARTEEDFAAVQYHWDRRDSNRERKERYHEVLRGDVPLDVGIAKNPHVFPEWLGTPVAQQMRSGNYLDWLANCPYEMHDLLADAVLSSLIYSLKEDHTSFEQKVKEQRATQERCDGANGQDHGTDHRSCKQIAQKEQRCTA